MIHDGPGSFGARPVRVSRPTEALRVEPRLHSLSCIEARWSVPEDLNTEIAETMVTADGDPGAPRTRSDSIVEIVEAILLAIVAIATAWCGYQAARWDGRQAELYGRSSTIRNEADQALTLGGQQRLLDVSTFNTWIQAQNEGHDELAALYERRFSPEFKTAFDAWIALDPFSNTDAPPGPSFMPEYVNPLLEQGAELNHVAERLFEAGTTARHHADRYIRTAVVLASVLFLLVLSQRFKIRRVRLAVLVVAIGLMAYGLGSILTFPRY